jgi:hypothetical protein
VRRLPFTFPLFPFTFSAMSAEQHERPYSQLIINAWTALCALVSAVLFLAFAFGPHLLKAGHWVWDLLRYLASPII